jgi:hypothetical protein
VKHKLPVVAACPACHCDKPIAEMAINKLFRPTTTTIYTRTTMVWEVRCADCNPEAGAYFWFRLDQCDTPAKALGCIMQLNHEGWSPAITLSFIELMERLFGRRTSPRKATRGAIG